MSTVNRREVLRSLLAGALQTAGTVVLACSVLPAAVAQGQEVSQAEGDLQERADRVASEEDAQGQRGGPPEYRGGFRRGGFGNGRGGGGGFRRGGFGNGGFGGGGFRRGGGFRNF
jgi:hypothetical protein